MNSRPRHQTGKKHMVKQTPNYVSSITGKSDIFDDIGGGGVGGDASQRAQLLREVRHFQRIQEEQDECSLPWSLFYSHCRGSLDLPLREQIRLRYQQPDVEFSSAATAAAAENKIGKTASRGLDKDSEERELNLGSFGSSLDEYGNRLADDDLLNSYHRLLVSYGSRVEWQLYFKSEEHLQKRVRDQISCLTLALLENSESAAVEIDARVGSAITSILVETLAGLINRFSRKWRMVLMADHEDSIAAIRSNYERTAIKLRSFLHVSRLSFLASMLRPNPEYRLAARNSDLTSPLNEALVAAAKAIAAPSIIGRHQNVAGGSGSARGNKKGSEGGAGYRQRDISETSGISGGSGGSAVSGISSAVSRGGIHIQMETQSVAWPSQQLWADEQIAWQPCRNLKMFEAPVRLLNASDCLESDACFGAFSAARRRCQSLIGSPCTGRLGRFCLDRRCSRREQMDSVERWMFVGDTFIGLLNTDSNEIEEVMLFDAEFHILTNKDVKQLGVTGMKLTNNYCQLHVAFQREVDSRVLAHAIDLAMNGDTYSYSDDAPISTMASTVASGFRGAFPTASNGFLFSHRLSLVRSNGSSLLSSMASRGSGLRISDHEAASASAVMEEKALAAAVAVAAANSVGKNSSNTNVEARSELKAMTAAAAADSTDNSDSSYYVEQRQQQHQLRQQRRKRRKKQLEIRQSGSSAIGRAERSEQHRPSELEQQQMQFDLDQEVPVHSFAPPRQATKAQWYVDAGSYFYAVADAIDMAQAEIFVCGSVLTPEVYLKRPDPNGRYQLGRLLIEKVFILLDNPNCLKDTNSCLHVLDYFEGVSNVHIMLSPFDLDDASSAFFKPALGLMKAFLVMRRRLYSRCFGRFLPGLRAANLGGSSSKTSCRAENIYYKHNEKCVVIDQKVALVSGVDLTWGSWDTSLHVINDVPTNSTTAMTELGPQQYRGQEACVRTFWMNTATLCTEMTPPIMSCLDEDATEDDRANARPARSEAAMMYLPESLRDLVVPKEKLGMDSDYDNFAHTQRAYMTKPYSVFTDANDPKLNPQYFEAVRLLDSHYRNAVRVAWTFQRKSVRMPDLRVFEAPGCLPDKVEEPAFASVIFPIEDSKRQTAASGDGKIDFDLLKQETYSNKFIKTDSEPVKQITNEKPAASADASVEESIRSRKRLLPGNNIPGRGGAPRICPVPSGALSCNNSNAESVSLDDLAKYHVCVASCMVMQRDKSGGFQRGMSDDSDSDDLECFPTDMMQPLVRSINKSTVDLKHTNWLAHRISVERHMASVQRKLLELRRQQGQHQYNTESASSTSYSSISASVANADLAQLSKRKQLLIESLETTSELRQPLLKRHFAVKDDGSRFTTRLFPGLDYANSRLLTLSEAHYNHPNNPPSSLDPEREPRLPVHSVGLAIFGSAARDVARHFIQRWNFACSNVYRQARKPIQFGSHGKALEAFLNKPMLVPRFYVAHDLEDCELLVRRTECLRSVLDYPNTGRRLSLSNQTVNVLVLNLDEGRNRRSGFENDDRQQQQQQRRQQQQQQQKNERGKRSSGGRNAISDDVRRELAKNEQTLQGANVANMPVFLTEKSVRNLEGNEVVQDEEFVNCLERLSQGRVPHSCRVTVLRSLGKWSGGLYRQLEERSILQAYYSAIKTSRKFLYLESELFVSQSRNRSPETALVQNRVSFYMYKRILAARQVGEAFRIYLVIPLLPRHQGRLLSETDGDYINRREMQHVYGAIFRGEDSLVHRLLQRNIAPDEYLSVCSLQKYERIPDGWLAQDIYVQSNLLIADDRLAIIGSPSVTDRGLLGYKNSELAVRLEDPPSSGGSGGFVRSLRMTLWGEHLDMPARFREAAIGDPAEAAVWALWRGRATRNSQIMYEVFRSVPNNAANTIERLRDFTSLDYLRRRAKLYSNSRINVGQGLEKLAGFCGSLVRYSGHFLEGNDLTYIDEDSKRWRAALLWPDFSLV